MRPAEPTRVWRKSARSAAKGMSDGRRARRPYIAAPQRGSTWLRRHPGEVDYWRKFVGARRVPADRRKAVAS